MSSIEDPLDRAIKDGKFDNLSGKGKPLRLDDDPFVDPEWRLAHHMLKENGFTLPWIEARQEIEAQATAARAALRRAWEDRQAGPANPAQAAAEWERALAAFDAQAQAINRRIRDYNLQAPSTTLQLPVLNVAREIDRLKAI